MKKRDFLSFLDGVLQPELVKDYCPNGLQVEGRDEITRILTGVTASQALIDKAIEHKVDALLVHHGYFWKGEDQTITGLKKKRIQSLLQHDISLIAYHLPLDIHATLGNNAQLGKLLEFENIQPHPTIKPRGIVMTGSFAKPIAAKALTKQVDQIMSRECLHVQGSDKTELSTVAWCTGGGQGYIDALFPNDIDVFISGEISEQTTHSARELGIDFIAAGHHATERYGVKALGEFIKAQTDIEVVFVDIDNPA